MGLSNMGMKGIVGNGICVLWNWGQGFFYKMIKKIHLTFSIAEIVVCISCLSACVKTAKASELVFVREECHGAMNVIECGILIEKEVEGKYIDYQEYKVTSIEILNEPYKYDEKNLLLAGGEKLILSLKPGKYRIKCFTPVQMQNRYLDAEYLWESEYLFVEMKKSDTKTIAINPRVDETGYSGSWEIYQKVKI